MINLLSQNGHQSYGIKEYILDEPADLDNLPITDKMGSTAFIISTSQIYMINGKGEWKETSAKVSGGGIIHIDLADYGLYLGSENVSIPQEFVDILKDALDNRKAPYVHGAIKDGMESTILLDTMYMLEDIMIVATGVGVLVNDRVFPAWFAIIVNQENLRASVVYGPLEGERGEPGADGFSPTINVSQESDKIVITITDVNGTNIVEIPDVSAVSSVNGQTGAVVLTARDVGAATVDDVNQLKQDFADRFINLTDYGINIYEMFFTGQKEAELDEDTSRAFWGKFNEIYKKFGFPVLVIHMAGTENYMAQIQGMSVRDDEAFWANTTLYGISSNDWTGAAIGINRLAVYVEPLAVP